MNRRRFLSLLALPALTGALPLDTLAAAEGGLDGYLARPEPAYRWEKREEKKVAGGTIYELHLVSQVWQNETWEHRLQLFCPDKPDYPDFCTLLNTGGGGSKQEDMLGTLAAQRSGANFAILYHIPKQPLYGGLTEDALIVYTWKKYLETGDDSWPLHFPMAKAVLKAMDAIQELTKGLNKPIQRFLITGASKRGWTTWLVGASRDKRVAGIAPMVIDTLNVRAQIPHQHEMYPALSDEIADYTASGLDKLLLTEGGKRLMALEDPYSYRDRLTLPKLLLLGTNDRYWSQDALNLYWDDLKGPKWVCYIPNSGHGLEDRTRLLNTLLAFSRVLAGKKKWPQLSWRHAITGRSTELSVKSDLPITSARLFRCTSATTDFRDSKWTSEEVTPESKKLVARYSAPDTGYAAVYGELTFSLEEGRTFTLTTQLAILGRKP